MEEVFLILDDEPLTRRNIQLVRTEEQAKLITEDEEYMYYECVKLMDDKSIKDILCEKVLDKIEDWETFYNIHCNMCDISYNEVCPYDED